LGIKTQRRATKAAYAQRLELIEDYFTAKLFKFGAELDNLMLQETTPDVEEEVKPQKGKGKGQRRA